MKMSTNEHQSADERQHANRRSNLDLDEFNRMERPSRVFSSRHHFSMAQMGPSLDENNRLIREPNIIGSSQRILGNGVNGDIARNRSLVNFTGTDSETRQVTVAGQIPLLSSPSNNHQNTTNNSGGADSLITIGSDDETPNIDFRRQTEHRRLLDHYNSNVHALQPSRFSRSGRRSRRITDHPYLTRQEIEMLNAPSTRFFNPRRVRFSSINHRLNDSPDRSQTPEQELPEIEEPEIEFENHDDDDDDDDVIFDGVESMSSMSSISSPINGDSGDEPIHYSVAENRDNPNEITDYIFIPPSRHDPPRNRIVPFIMSPIPLSPRPISPSDTRTPPSEALRSSPLIQPFLRVNEDDREDHLNPVTPLVDIDAAIPGSNTLEHVQYNSVSRSDSVNREIDVEPNNTANNMTNAPLSSSIPTSNVAHIGQILREIERVGEDGLIETVLRPRPESASVAQRENQATEETSSTCVEKHPETYDDLNEQLTRLFECPVCFEHIVPPIFQCLLGHLICNKCVMMCENCPTCRNPFNSKRNLYMEKVGYLVKFPCRNTLTGCKQQMFIAQKEIHEQACCYRHYQCFFTNCAWKGYYPELQAHMNINHGNCILHGTEQFLDITFPANNQTFKWFLVAHGEYFAIIAHSSLPPRRVKLQVNYIGHAVKAKNFKFVITLTQPKDRTNDGTNVSQKLVYERSTLPYSEVYEMSNNNGLKKDIFSFPVEVLEPYIRKRRRLPIVLKIHSKTN